MPLRLNSRSISQTAAKMAMVIARLYQRRMATPPTSRRIGSREIVISIASFSVRRDRRAFRQRSIGQSVAAAGDPDSGTIAPGLPGRFRAGMRRTAAMTDTVNHGRRRVVVIGLGALTALADSAEGTWQRLLAGESGVSRIERWDPGDLPVQIGAEIKDTPELPMIDAKQARNIARYAHFGIAAAGQPRAEAALPDNGRDHERARVILGTGAGGMAEIPDMTRTLDARGYRRVSPHFTPTFPHNMASYHTAQAVQLLGPNSTVSTACATGAQAIADAF